MTQITNKKLPHWHKLNELFALHVHTWTLKMMMMYNDDFKWISIKNKKEIELQVFWNLWYDVQMMSYQ